MSSLIFSEKKKKLNAALALKVKNIEVIDNNNSNNNTVFTVDTLTPYHTFPKIWKWLVPLPADVFKILLDEWQIV